MDLYYHSGTCSLSPHIALREVGADFRLIQVDLATHRTADGRDYYAINPKGYVPALRLDDGEVVTEGVALVQYIADRFPQAGLAPANGTLARTRLQELLNFISAELHKSFSPLFSPATSEEGRAEARARVGQKLDHLESVLSDGRAYLTGDRLTVADTYLYAVARWTGPTGIDLARWPRLSAFMQRVTARPAVQAALAAEGLS